MRFVSRCGQEGERHRPPYPCQTRVCGHFQTLVLSLDARRDYSAGEITNFAIIDAGRMTEHIYVIHLTFSLPIQVRRYESSSFQHFSKSNFSVLFGMLPAESLGRSGSMGWRCRLFSGLSDFVGRISILLLLFCKCPASVHPRRPHLSHRLVSKMRPPRRKNASHRRNFDKYQNGEILRVGRSLHGFHWTSEEAGNSKATEYVDFKGAWRIPAYLHYANGWYQVIFVIHHANSECTFRHFWHSLECTLLSINNI